MAAAMLHSDPARLSLSTVRDTVVAFFFTFNDESKQDMSAALRALLLQLCGQVSGLEADLIHLKSRTKIVLC